MGKIVCIHVFFVVTVGIGGGVSGSFECREGSGNCTSVVSSLADFGEVPAQHGRVGNGVWMCG